jgi:hypothetical protein
MGSYVAHRHGVETVLLFSAWLNCDTANLIFAQMRYLDIQRSNNSHPAEHTLGQSNYYPSRCSVFLKKSLPLFLSRQAFFFRRLTER